MFEIKFYHVDEKLLTAQYEFFAYTMEWVSFLDLELGARTGRLPPHPWPRPTEQAQPPFHNPPAAHIPPWLPEDQKALHLARALAAQRGDPTPTPKQQALDKARTEKSAKRHADRARDLAKRSEPKRGE